MKEERKYEMSKTNKGLNEHFGLDKSFTFVTFQMGILHHDRMFTQNFEIKYLNQNLWKWKEIGLSFKSALSPLLKMGINKFHPPD